MQPEGAFGAVTLSREEADMKNSPSLISWLPALPAALTRTRQFSDGVAGTVQACVPLLATLLATEVQSLPLLVE